MSRAVVRTDRTSGYQWCDFYVDQASQWAKQAVWHDTDENSLVVNLTGFTARLTVREADLARGLALDVIPFVDGPNGRVVWIIDADLIAAALTRPTYDYQLVLLPADDPAQAFVWMQGQIVMRPKIEVIL